MPTPDPGFNSYVKRNRVQQDYERTRRALDGFHAAFTAPFQVSKALRQLTIISPDEAAAMEVWYAR